MIINISHIRKEEPERLEIYCHNEDHKITEIVRFVKSLQGQLTGMIEGAQYEIPVSDVFYMEGVDNKVFIYCENQVYETRQKLYELEEDLREKHFLRVSKSVLLNLMKVESIKASLNGRFIAVLQNGEQVIVSRKYVPELKNALKGGNI
ncbi:MAG: LytTR family transcriptional regulator DNA-binding domain-containing protein [Clostridium sp.]|nr:LytTR family transcriptional regulator DNA-binding domain-containing protein [Clostridium sp.]